MSASSINPQAGEVRVDEHGIPMVYVPAGKFLMGSTEQQVEEAIKTALIEFEGSKEEWFTLELPQHEIVFPNGFWIDQFPVTNEVFSAFTNDGGYNNEQWWTKAGWKWLQSGQKFELEELGQERFTRPKQPRVWVTWYEAVAYANWRKARLPTEAEWEYAAHGPQNLIYPWGNEWNPDVVVWRNNSNHKTAEVGSKPEGRSWVNAYDMTGNAQQWCSSLGRPYPYDPKDGRENLDVADERVRRGGSWTGMVTPRFRCAYRYFIFPDDENEYTGFRCIRSTL